MRILLSWKRVVIIPRKGLGEIRRLVEDVPGDVLIGIRQGMCVVKTDHVLLKSVWSMGVS